jgi:dsRNA-specific ribonuclease
LCSLFSAIRSASSGDTEPEQSQRRVAGITASAFLGSAAHEVTASIGPDHDRSFECAVFHEGRELGRGHSKGASAPPRPEAALAALLTLKSEPAAPRR